MQRHTATSLTIAAADGFGLAASLYRCRRPRPLGTLVVAAAVGNVRQNYADYAGAMADRGWDVLTFDYRGMGGSRAPAEAEATFTMVDWGEKDLAGVLAWARGELNPRRLVLVGHSIGGQVAAFAANHAELDALVGVAAQRGYWRYWTGLKKYVVYLFFGVYIPLCVKKRGHLPLNWTGLENLPGAAAGEWGGWGVTPEYRDRDGISLEPRFEQFRSPILAMSFSDDWALAPKRAVDVLFADHYVNAPVTRWHLRPEALGVKELGHSGFFRPGVCPESLWDWTTQWILRACSRGREGGPHQGTPDAEPQLQAVLQS
jgi:predicted alpha/beta hydrolase